MNKLFEDKKWIGEFFTPDEYENRFVGEVTYSPKGGVVLSYTCVNDKSQKKSNVLHGVFTSGEKCTLIGNFDPNNSGISIKNNLFTKPGKAGFAILVIGDFIEKEDKFTDLSFTLSNLQEFFFPKGFKDFVKYSDKPLLEINTSFGQLEVGNNASFGFLHKDITGLIYSRNEEALNELKMSFEAIDKKHNNANFMLKKDIAYRIHLKIESGASVEKSYEHIHNLSNLFALLIFSPVYPESITFTKSINDETQKFSLDAYPSLYLDERTFERSIESKSHHHMPIKNSNINLGDICAEWLKSPNDFSTLISAIQHDTGFRNEHTAYGEAVLYATQFESISHGDSIKDKKNKYEYPLLTYGSTKISEKLQSIFKKAGIANNGEGISEIRNEIAHVGKPKVLLNKLSLGEIMEISQCLQLTIIGYVFTKIRIDKTIIENYQNKFCVD